jgi:hypothetical protein
METTTRHQLKGYGLTVYLAIAITKTLTPVRKDKNTNHYSLNEVITSIRAYCGRERVKTETLERLNSLLNILQERQDNLIVVSFTKGTDAPLSELAKKAYLSLEKTTQTMSLLKAEAATIKGKNGRRKSNRKVI